MGNQSLNIKFTNKDQSVNASTPPPRPKKPDHLRRPRINTLPEDPSDPRAFNLPLDGSLLHYGSPAATPFDNSSGVYETVDSTDIQSESTPIGEIIEEYGAQLPLRFSISESLYGVCEESSLMEGQLLNVHFEKETKVVCVKANTGAEYVVPLNSLLIFSILYNPENKVETAKKGYMFPKVSDIINATVVPQAVVVTTAFQCSQDSGDILLVMEGQVLIINSMTFNEDTNTKHLKCLMLKRNTTLLLDENIVGNFSTCSSMLKFQLAEIIEHVSLPISVTLENSGDKKIQLPLHATVGTYTITDQKVEKSVIVSSKYNQGNELIEILLSVPIELHLIKISQQQLQLLRLESQSIFNSFHPSKLTKVVFDSNSSMNYIQSMLFKVVPENDTWKHGIDLFPPQPPSTSFQICNEDEEDYLEMSMDNVVDSQTAPSNTHSPYEFVSTKFAPSIQGPRTNVSDSFIDSRPLPPVPHSHSIQGLSSQQNTLTQEESFRSLPRRVHQKTNLPPPGPPGPTPDPVPYMIVRDTGGGTLTHEAPYEYVKLSHERRLELDVLRKKLNELESTNTQLETHIKELNKEQQAPTPPVIYDTAVTEANRNIISSYTCEQLLEVLDKLKLEQYKENFLTEGINGALFLDLDEEILEMELNVKSKIHRLRIMRLVSGKQSVKDLS